MKIFVDQAMRGAPVGESLPDMAYMMLFCIPAILMINRLKRECTYKKYWGKS